MNFNPTKLRKKILEMAYNGQSVHIGCSFSIVEIVSTLYRSLMNLGDGSPRSVDRDYLVLSKGHGVMAVYACMHELGWLTQSDIDNYFKDGTHLKGLSESDIPGLEVSSGSLGHGLSVGVGLALAAKLNKETRKVFCIVGDGELNEGSIWEAIMFAAHFKLDNLVVIVDANSFQAMGRTDEVLDMGCLVTKFNSFGFCSKEVDGHQSIEIESNVRELLSQKDGKPKALVAKTGKGFGVSFMNGDNSWHYTRLTHETYSKALAELDGEEVL